MHALFSHTCVMRKLCVAANGVMHFSCVALAAHFFIYEGEIIMPDYNSMYLDLFNSITDAIEILCEVQKKAEENFINSLESEKE